MGRFLTKKQRLELREAHRVERNSRHSDRIKAVLLLDADWPVSKISEALLLDGSTIRSYKSRYESGGLEALCDDAYVGRQSKLGEEELLELEAELRRKIYLSTSEIIDYVKKQFKVCYSTSGLTYLLHSLGFSYKKPGLVPGKADEHRQQAFLESYQELKSSKKAKDKVYFGDGVHPQHNSLPSYGWLPKGEETKLKSNTGRQRVNISGALDAETHEVITQQSERLNAETTIDFFKLLERKNPEAETIYIILDNAGYYKGEKIREYLKTSKVKILFLPPYAPNLNLIERLWKFFKKMVLYNKYYANFCEFKCACMDFFKKKNLKKYKKQLDSLLTENFQIVSA